MVMTTMKRLKPFAMTVLLVAVATAIQSLFWPFIGIAPYLLFFPVVVISNLYGSPLFATFLSLLSAHYFFTEPFYHFSFRYPQDLVRASLFTLASLTIRHVGLSREHALRSMKDKQNKLQESERRFRSTFENVAIGMAHVALDGKWLLVNEKLCDLLGYAREELLTKTFAEITHPDDIERDWEQARALIAGKIASYKMEKRYFHKNGSAIWIHLTVGLKHSPDGQPKYFVISVEDIRERRALQKKYRDLFDHVIEEVHFWKVVRDHDGNIKTWTLLDANPPALTRWGKNLSDVIGKTPDELFGSGTLAKARPHIEKIMTSRTAVTYEDYFPHSDRHFHFTAFPLGEQFILTGTDITVLKKAYAMAEHERSQLQAVFEAVSDGIAVFDMNGRILLVNSAINSIGLAPSKPLALNLEHMPYVFELRDLQGTVLPVDKWPIHQIRQGRSIANIELQVRHLNDPRERYISFSGQPVYDEAGTQTLSVLSMRDVTETKKMEQALQQSEAQFRRYAEEMPQMAFIADRSGNITYFNQRFYDYIGVNTSLEGWKWQASAIHHPEDLERTLDVWTHALETGSLYQIEYRLRRYDGQYRWHLGRAIPIRNAENEIEQWIGTNTDIQELYEVRHLLKESKELAEAANAAKSRFLANMSHELRTPLTAVLGFADILRDSNLREEERQDALDRIERSGHTLLRLIDDVLDISKIEAGKTEFHQTRFSPIAVVNEVVSLFKLQTERKGIQIRRSFSPTVPEIAYSDQDRIRQILTNLIGNAVKFTDHGEISVVVKGEVQPQNGKQFLIFEISDTGIGIGPDDQSKLFQPFAQADESITRRFGGTGLGLILSRRLAEQLGGSLQLRSSVKGQGSCFVTKIEAGPFASFFPHEKHQRTDEPPPQAPQTNRILEGSKLLLVEDVPDNQVLMRRYLEGAGAFVDLASTGTEALEKTIQSTYDVILMDIQLPDMDGIQTTEKLRARGYTRPILALTAHAMPEEVNRSLRAGCNQHLTKPVAKAHLIESVKRWSP